MLAALVVAGCASGGSAPPDAAPPPGPDAAAVADAAAPPDARDPCDFALCDPIATCTVIGGIARCMCPAGYADVQGNGTECVDVDECGLELDDCAADADCENVPGGFSCTCHPGYAGDGVTCEDVDECGDGSAGCAADADCENSPGSFACTCRPGYHGDGVVCDDDDECDLGTDDCAPAGLCENLPGSFACSCGPGYLDEIGDGRVCQARAVGSAVLIGHDLFASHPFVDRLVGNAVFSAPTAGEVAVLAYQQYADRSAAGEAAHADAAITAHAAELGRTWTRTALDDADLLAATLPGHHVLLVYEQETANAATMATVGTAWAEPLAAFVDAGGVVVVLDFSGSSWQILHSAGLMTISANAAVPTGSDVAVTEPADPLADGLDATYTATSGTRAYTSADGLGVAGTAAGAVVVRRTFGSGCVAVEDFEAGAWPSPPWRPVSGAAGSVSVDAAHDFTYGGLDLGWSYQTAVLLGEPGDRLSAWVRFSTAASGRVYLGFAAGAAGTWSLVAAPNTNQLILMENAGYTYANRAMVTHAYAADQWYRLEVQLGAGGVVTGRVYGSDGTTVINSVSHTVPVLPRGGVALRSFGTTAVDTVVLCR